MCDMIKTVKIHFTRVACIFLIFFCEFLYSQNGFKWINPNPDDSSKNNCGNCHAKIYKQWLNSAHAKSSTNPWVIDMYYGTSEEGVGMKDWGPGYKRDFPNSSGDCVFCHVPTAAVEAPFKTEFKRSGPNAILEKYADDNVNYVTGMDTLGISCHFCHRIENAQYYSESHMPGVLSYSLNIDKNDFN